MKSFNSKMFSIFFLFLVTLFFLFYQYSKKDSVYSKSEFFFDTVITISIYGNNNHADDLISECFEKCTYFEKTLSRTYEGSDIYQINHAKGQPVDVSDDTITVLTMAKEYASLSNGVIDPTVAPLSALWNIDEQCNLKYPSIPSDNDIKEKLSHINYKCINIDGNTVSLSDPEAQLDLGFIAKGYIADCLKSYLVSQKVSSAIINLGGNVLTIGTKSKKDSFCIGIRKPFSDQNTALLSIMADDCSVVSSGCYERYFQKNGKLYHHILDTTTGFPIQNNLYSVTILSKSSMLGDTLSTWCYAIGYEKALSYIESQPDIEAIFIFDDYSVKYSSGITDNMITIF